MKQLIERLRNYDDCSDTDVDEAADAIESLMADKEEATVLKNLLYITRIERDALKRDCDAQRTLIDSLTAERDALNEDLIKHRELLVYHLSVIDPLRAEIKAMREQKPVAWRWKDTGTFTASMSGCNPSESWIPLYAAPGAKP